MPSSRASEAAEERTDAPPGHEQEHPGQGGHEAAALREELAEVQERYKRALADLDNYRKRAAREVERRRIELRDQLMREWLDVIDSIERALRVESEGPLAQGLLAVLEQIDTILARHGVQRIGVVGERFDPEHHEAVGVRETDEVEDQTIVEVARSGFAIGDDVLRPAQVVVARMPRAET